MSFIGGDGVALTGDNEISGISIQTSPANRAIYIDSPEVDLGTIRLEHLTVTGVVQLLTRAPNKVLSLDLSDIDIVSADARHYPERPMKYGVNVYQGALTIYNFNPEAESRITLHAEHIGVGREKAPVIGSGIFISGFNDTAGPVIVDKLTTTGVYSNGMIPTGQPNLITGGIFIVYGVEANEIVSLNEVKTYGTNDMVLDVWGKVKSWVVKENVTSYGASGIGFVNFGDVDYFKSEKTIQTYGLGARGFNQYDGTIKDAYFEQITTVGNGSIGMQFSKPVGNITIGSGIKTLGAKGQTLVKGEIVELNADAISVLHGGLIETLTIDGDVVTSGDHVVSYHVNGGVVQALKLGGKLVASGNGAKPAVIEQDGSSDTTGIEGYLS
ncbi:hypothetical protein [Stomatohabitans albus]|uniref:hypothetical protein n=1 Tax=Stomatohabitans albus TaxID=3110766 RepID=UPI00300C22EC